MTDNNITIIKTHVRRTRRKPLVFVWRIRFIIIIIFCLSCYAAARRRSRAAPRCACAFIVRRHESRSSSTSHARPIFTRGTRTAVAVNGRARSQGRFRESARLLERTWAGLRVLSAKVTGAADKPESEKSQRSRVRRAVPHGVPACFLSACQLLFFPFWPSFSIDNSRRPRPGRPSRKVEATSTFQENYKFLFKIRSISWHVGEYRTGSRRGFCFSLVLTHFFFLSTILVSS